MKLTSFVANICRVLDTSF